MHNRFRRPFRRLVSSRRPLRTGFILTLLALAGAWLFFACSGAAPGASQMLGLPATVSGNDAPTAQPTPSQATEAPVAAGEPAPATARSAAAPATPAEGGQAQPPVETPTASPTPADVLALMSGNRSTPVSDLMFIAGNQLLLWQRRSQQVRVLAQNPESFVASADGAVVLTLHAGNVTVNGSERYELRRVTPASGAQTVLLANTPRPKLLTLSPDGRYAAYALSGDRTLVYTLEVDAPQGAAAPPVITPQPTPDAAAAPADRRPAPIGACEAPQGDECTSLAWSNDSRNLAWTDARGIWIVDMAAREPRLAHDLQVEVADPKGQISTYEANFDALEWSPDGRFILLRVVPKNSRVMWRAVLDVRSGKLASATDSFALEEAEAQVIWLGPDRIAVAHASDLLRGSPPFIHLWNVFATNPQLLVSGQQYDLYSEDFPFSSQASKDIPAHQIDWLSNLIPGKLLFGVKLPQTQTQPVLFTLDLTTGIIVKLQTLPEETDRLAYAPDSSGALVGGAGGYAFAPLTGEPLIDLNRVFSQSARQIQWLAPGLPRKP